LEWSGVAWHTGKGRIALAGPDVGWDGWIFSLSFLFELAHLITITPSGDACDGDALLRRAQYQRTSMDAAQFSGCGFSLVHIRGALEQMLEHQSGLPCLERGPVHASPKHKPPCLGKEPCLSGALDALANAMHASTASPSPRAAEQEPASKA
jgi:hypothetical protein